MKILLILLLCTAIMHSSPSFAGQPSDETYELMSTEHKRQCRMLYTQHLQTLNPLRDSLLTRYLELDALSHMPGVTKREVEVLVEEIVNLRRIIRDKQEAYAESLALSSLSTYCGIYASGFTSNLLKGEYEQHNRSNENLFFGSPEKLFGTQNNIIVKKQKMK